MSNENAVKNKVKVVIADNQFTLVSSDSESYTKSIAEEVNQKIDEIKQSNPGVSTTAAVILTALNYCDSIRQGTDDSESLKRKLNAYLEESAKDKDMISKLQSENEKLKKDIEIYRKRLGESGHSKSPVSSAVKAAYKTVSAQEEAAEDETDFFAEENVSHTPEEKPSDTVRSDDHNEDVSVYGMNGTISANIKNTHTSKKKKKKK